MRSCRCWRSRWTPSWCSDSHCLATLLQDHSCLVNTGCLLRTWCCFAWRHQSGLWSLDWGCSPWAISHTCQIPILHLLRPDGAQRAKSPSSWCSWELALYETIFLSNRPLAKDWYLSSLSSDFHKIPWHYFRCFLIAESVWLRAYQWIPWRSSASAPYSNLRMFSESCCLRVPHFLNCWKWFCQCEQICSRYL